MSAFNLIKNPIRFDGSGYLSLDIPACTLYQLWADRVGNYGEYETSSHPGGTYNVGQNRSGILCEFYGIDGDGNEVVRLQWDGIGLPWNAVNGERATLVSGSIRPLCPVTRVEGQRGPGYKIQPGSKIFFSDVPAGTLQITKREDGIITTVESDFTGGTLELTEPDLLDAKIVDSSGNELFALGKKVGNTVFDAINPTQTGEISGNVEVVEREVVWGMEFDGTGYIACAITYDHDLVSVLGSYVVKSFPGYHALWDTDSGAAIPLGTFIDPNFFVGAYEGWWAGTHLNHFGNRFCITEVFKSNLMELYTNGVLAKTTSKPFPQYQFSEFYVGRRSNGLHKFVGLVHLPFIIYAKALPQPEISLLTQRRFNEVSRDGLVLCLDYDPSTGQLIDRSPYNHQIQAVGGVQIKRVML